MNLNTLCPSESSTPTLPSQSPTVERFVTVLNAPAEAGQSTPGFPIYYLEAKQVHIQCNSEFVEIDDFVAELEQDPDMAERLQQARQRMADFLDDTPPILSTLRLKVGLSQSQVASAIGNSQSGYSMIESGKREPAFSTYEKLVEVLKVSRDELAQAINNTMARSQS